MGSPRKCWEFTKYLSGDSLWNCWELPKDLSRTSSGFCEACVRMCYGFSEDLQLIVSGFAGDFLRTSNVLWNVQWFASDFIETLWFSPLCLLEFFEIATDFLWACLGCPMALLGTVQRFAVEFLSLSSEFAVDFAGPPFGEAVDLLTLGHMFD